MKEYIVNDRCKDPENRSNKFCLCGGHSAKDVKKNLHHNSTRKKYNHRVERIFKSFCMSKATEMTEDTG